MLLIFVTRFRGKLQHAGGYRIIYCTSAEKKLVLNLQDELQHESHRPISSLSSGVTVLYVMFS